MARGGNGQTGRTGGLGLGLGSDRAARGGSPGREV